jgi:hypothetical protein
MTNANEFMVKKITPTMLDNINASSLALGLLTLA